MWREMGAGGRGTLLTDCTPSERTQQAEPSCRSHTSPSRPVHLTSLMVMAASEAERLLRRMMASSAVPSTTLRVKGSAEHG